MLVPVTDAIRGQQERKIDNLQFCSRHRIADQFLNVVKSSKNTSPYDQSMAAALIGNFARVMDSDLGSKWTTTHAGDFGPYIMEVWPLVTAWYPDFPLKDLISVQPMDKPLAYMFFSMLKTSTSKGDTLVGDIVETALGSRKIRGKYPSGEIMGESILDNQITSQGTILAYAPLNVAAIPGYLAKTMITIGSAKYEAYNTNGSKILFKKGGVEQADSVITIDIQTGALTGSAVAAAQGSAGTEAIKANYVWDLDYADTDNIQKVKEQVEMRPMEATPRAIALEWTLFSEYLKKTQFGVDIREDNTKRILNLLYQFQVRYILDDMYMYRDTAAHPDVTVTAQTNTGIALEVVSQRVQKQLKDMAGKVLKASGRMEGNRIVVGLNFKNWLESLPSNLFTPSAQEDAFMQSPREIGKYGTFTVFYDPELEDDKFWMTYRGKEFYDAAYYLGEYLPITPTDCVALGVTVRSSFVSMEAYRYDKKNCVIGGKFQES